MIFLLKQILLPPISLILLALLGLALLRRGRNKGWWISVAALTLLLILATPLGVTLLAGGRAVPAPLRLSDLAEDADAPQAIVIVGCDSDFNAEFGGADVGPLTLARLRYGGRLQRRTGLPILLSGGPLNHDQVSLAELMQRSLKADFQLTGRWVEEKSKDTWENAVLSAAILRQQGISRIYLVTQARDMARAQWSFERTGLRVVAAPTGFEEQRPGSWRDISPSVKSLLASYYTAYEMTGGLFYRLRH